MKFLQYAVIVAVGGVLRTEGEESNKLEILTPFSVGSNITVMVLTNGLGDVGTNIDVKLQQNFKAFKIGDLSVSPCGTQDSAIVFSRGVDSYIFTPGTRLLYSDPVAKDGRTVYFLVQRYTAKGKGNLLYQIDIEYRCLAEFDIPAAPSALSNMTSRAFLGRRELLSLVESRQAWVVKLDQISQDGERLLLEIAEEDSSQARYGKIHFPHRRYWYQLREKRLTREGN